ncbi:MAG: cytochrome-c oxidase, cbb3-type subunit III [Gammaproteobacteria bacterium]|jgi:cytochrome c oxidase cbb3-type subunit III|nr:cytochrome-c oxidase, cbb3-type subunit III [Gammaproteobacteria bacterium]
MADFNSALWSIVIAAVTVVSILALLWFTWSQAAGRRPTAGQKVETMGHTWDGDLAEFNNPLPKWWLNLFYITLVWGLGYLIAYPGLGAFKGMLGWSAQNQYDAEVAKADATYGPLFDKYKAVPVEQLVNDQEALTVGKRLFATYCTQCHGSDAGGARGFPNLTDNDWLWGGTPETIEQTILNGRQGAMPAWVAVIGEDGVKNVASYVEHLAGRQVDAATVEAGQKVFSTTCIACHGPEGKGNALMGAPNLTDDVWLYGGSHERIAESITKGRNGHMPAHREFLGEAKVHLLSAYVYSFAKGNAPAQ